MCHPGRRALHQAALQAIADANGGTRVSGSLGYDQSVDYAVSVFTNAGYNVTVQPFQFQTFVSLTPAILEQVSPPPAGPIANSIMSYSGSGDVTAPVTALPAPPVDVHRPDVEEVPDRVGRNRVGLVVFVPHHDTGLAGRRGDAAEEKILISDTVGFIRKLPAHLVASFKSTLNEVRDSDIILHMIDLSHPYYEDHVKVVDETLKEFDSEHKKEIKVFNKVDSVSDKSIIEYVRNKYHGSVIISAQKGINISSLIKSIEATIKDSFVEEELTLRIEQTKLASQIHDLAEVTSVKYNHDTVLFKFRANKENSEKIRKLISKA